MLGNSFTARRAVSLPEKMTLPSLRIPVSTDEYHDYFDDEKASLLPLSGPSSPGRTARRLTMGLRLRAARYSVPLILVSICFTALYFFAAPSPSRAHGLQGRSRFHLKSHDPLHIPSRNLAAHAASGESNGLTLLLQNEDELIAEDDLYWDKEPDHKPLTDKEKAAEAEIQAHKLDVLEQNRMGSLRALIWWIAEGGVFPADWEIPSRSYLKRVGARGMERLLEDIDSGTDEEAIFEDGWADFAKRRYRIAVFSKSYCPYSRKAKGILEEYRLTPAPFVIELDQRPDTHTIQTLLDHLTGRRTVPNIIFDFVPVGGSDDLMLLHSEGGLKRQFGEMGVVPGSNKRPIPPQILPKLPSHDDAPAGRGGKAQPVMPKRPAEKAADVAKANMHGAGVPELEEPHVAAHNKKVAHAGKKPAAAPVKKPLAAAAQPVDEEPAQHAFNPPAVKHAPAMFIEDEEELASPEADADEVPSEKFEDEHEEDSAADADPEDDMDEEDEIASDTSAEEENIATPEESEAEEELSPFVPSAYEFDPELFDDYDEDHAAIEIPKDATAADIQAAIQAAHGEEYLYQSDDEAYDGLDGDFVGNAQPQRHVEDSAGHRIEPARPAPQRPNKVEAVAKKVVHAGAEKVAAALKPKERIGANGNRHDEAQAKEAAPKKAERPAPKKAANLVKEKAAALPKKGDTLPRNRAEAIAQKKAQAKEAIAEKEAEVAPKRKIQQVAPPKKKAGKANIDAQRRKGADKVDAREALKPAGKKDAIAKKNANGANAPAKKMPVAAAGGILRDNQDPTDNNGAPVKKNARFGAPGKQEMKLGGGKERKRGAGMAKKAEPAAAGAAKRKQAGGAGAKRETPAEAKKAAVVKKEEPKEAIAARREKLVEKADGGLKRKAAPVKGAKRAPDTAAKGKQAAKRKGKVL